MALELPKPEKFYGKMRIRAKKLELGSLTKSNVPPVKAYKEFIRYSSDWINRYHRSGGSGLRVVHCRSIAMDVLIEYALQLASRKVQDELNESFDNISILALGGYGRSELCPLSDIDIMFLYPNRQKGSKFKQIQKTINDTLLYLLWDLNLKVGHSTRTPKEAILEANADVQSKNAMLESRLICGSSALFKKFKAEYQKFIHRDNANTYITERLEDQKERRGKFGNSPFLQEPDIKSGVGGLRDYQNILWMISQSLGLTKIQQLESEGLLRDYEVQELEQSYDFLLRVRNELHLQVKRITDLLSLDIQPKVAWNLRYRQRDIFRRVELFMRDYYKSAQTIFTLSRYLEKRLFLNFKKTISFKEVLKSRRSSSIDRFDGFYSQGNHLFAENPNIFRQDPLRLIRVFRHLQRLDLKIDFELRRIIQENLDLIDNNFICNAEANKCFRSILQERGNVYPALRKMSTTGVLSKFIPEWESLRCLVQHEYYHRYTADEHTLNTIKQCDQIFLKTEGEKSRIYYEAIDKTEHPALIYIMLLLHDIGKGNGIENHAQVGTEIAKPILERIGINPRLSKKILFQIQNHLEMARIWQRFDTDDQKTIQSFAQRVEEKEKLRYLYVLTYCDARGTTENLWNSYKDTLHTNLFLATLSWLKDESFPDSPRHMISSSQIKESLEHLSEEEIDAHFNLLPDRYFSFHSEREVRLHLDMINRLLKNIADAESLGSLIPIVDWEDDLNLGLTVVHIVTWDRTGLFYKLSGAFALAGLSIVSSKALSRADHITIDTFYVCESNGGPIRDKSILSVFLEHLKDSLLYNKDLMDSINLKADADKKPSYLKEDSLLTTIPPKVEVYHELSLQRTILEVEATDEVGLLFKISKAIHDHGFDISFARISTEKHVAADTFYIDPIPSQKDKQSDNLIELRLSLLKLIGADTPTVK